MTQTIYERLGGAEISPAPKNMPLRQFYICARVVLVATVVIYAVLILLFPRFAASSELDHVFFNLPFFWAALVCWVRGRGRGGDNIAWRFQSAAMMCFLLGNLYELWFTSSYGVSPTWGDGLYLSYYVLSFVAISLYTKAHLVEFHASTWLDGAIGGVGVTALVSAFALGPALEITKAPTLSVVTNLAYPTMDLVLILLLVGVGHALRARDRSWQFLAIGMGVFIVADCFYLYQSSTGTLVDVSPIQVLWPIGITLIGLAACSVTSSTRAPSSSAHRYLIPVIFVASAVGLLVYGQDSKLPPIAVLLAVVTLLLAAGRMALTLREVRALAQSREEARSDFLTGLPNRRSLAEGLAGAMSRADLPTSLMVIDLDRFNEINNSLGHVAGDQLLREVGRRLLVARPAGSMLGRLGGDEFAVVLPASGISEAVKAARTITAAFDMPFGLIGLDIPVRASIGIAASPAHATSETGLLAAADIAMYQAKRDGSGTAVFRVENDNPSRDRLQLLSDLRTAVEENQFVLQYQPQLDIRSGRVVGVEALARWQHPVRGLVQPDDFIPLLTKSSLMRKFTIAVLRTATQTWADLRDQGHNISMSVNISAADLSNTALPDAVQDLLVRHDMPAGSLVLEVTEDAVMVDRQRSHELLHSLRELGSRVSVDDYGTGQASLAYLRDLPLDELKLDRSFLRGAPIDSHNAAIVRSTVELAHALELPIVAEGVEDRSALEWLTTVDCDLAQGYFISRPKPLAELLDLLESPLPQAI